MSLYSDQYTSDDINSTLSYDFYETFPNNYDIRKSGSNSFQALGNRETKSYKKNKQHAISCESIENKPLNYKPSLFTNDGRYIEQSRQNIRENIEDYYYSGRYINKDDKCVNSSNTNLVKPVNIKKEDFTLPKKICDENIEQLKKQNEIFIMLVFFLCVVIIVQYCNNISGIKPVQVIMIPSSTNTQ
jgi:uncharacterized membrane protein